MTPTKDELATGATLLLSRNSRRAFLGSACRTAAIAVALRPSFLMAAERGPVAVPKRQGVEPFRLAIPQADLDDLKNRLTHTRWPDAGTVSDWSQGVPLAQARDFIDYWRTRYDWRRCEATLNAFGQYRTTIDGLGIHFLHVRSPERDALPLVLSHGWPGSVIEFLKVIGALTDPAAHGGNPRDAFHVVIPSLPGYGFSDKPTERGWNTTRTAAAWVELMKRLGYGERWAAQGGDWGGAVSKEIAGLNPHGCVGIHMNRLFMSPTDAEKANANAEERQYIASAKRYQDELIGYAREQATRPQTIGYDLADSPAGQALWIYEKFHDWTDNDGRAESAVSRDQMLDDIMLYWLPNTGASSARMYAESYKGINETPPTRIPIAVTQFPKDLGGNSRRWVAKRYPTLMYWGTAEHGGHFAAFEQPEIFVREVRNGLRPVRVKA